MIERLLTVPVSIWISLAALVVSLLGFRFSLKSRNADARLTTAVKRTELLTKIIDTHHGLERTAQNLKFMNPPATSCREKAHRIVSTIDTLIEKLDGMKNAIERVPDKSPPEELERLNSLLYEILRGAESVMEDSQGLGSECRECKEKAEEADA